MNNLLPSGSLSQLRAELSEAARAERVDASPHDTAQWSGKAQHNVPVSPHHLARDLP